MRRAGRAVAILLAVAELSGSACLNAQPTAEPREASNPPSDESVAEVAQERISRALALVDVPRTIPELLQIKRPSDPKDGFFTQPLLEDAVVFAPVEAREGGDNQDVKPNELVFTARAKGIVLVAVPRSYDGDRTGGWFETRTSEDDLRASGWNAFRAVTLTSGNRDYGYAIFARWHDGRTWRPPFR